MTDNLNTGIKNVRNVSRYTFGLDSIHSLPKLINDQRIKKNTKVIFFLDIYFKKNKNINKLIGYRAGDEVIFVPTKNEPSTDYIDDLINFLSNKDLKSPSAIIGMGGGITLYVAKAVSNLLTNNGKAENYQGWDLLKKPGIYRGQCAELCGKDHAFMPIVVKAVDKSEYQKWVMNQQSNKIANKK